MKPADAASPPAHQPGARQGEAAGAQPDQRDTRRGSPLQICRQRRAEPKAAVQRAADAGGTTVVDLLRQRFATSNGQSVPTRPKPKSEWTEEEKQAARERFRRHAGAINLGYATGADNESIDADLAREYADNHEPKP